MLVAPEKVRAAFSKWYSWRAHSPSHIADLWFVSERTVRRWQKTGLPLCYGSVWIKPDEWAAFEQTGRVPSQSSSGLPAWEIERAKRRDRKVSARPGRRAAGRTGVDRGRYAKVSARSRGQVRP
jgi:hypothetical protein